MNVSCSAFFIKSLLLSSRSKMKKKYNALWWLTTYLTESIVWNLILPFTCCSSIICLSFRRLFSMTSFFACSKSSEEAASLNDTYYRKGNIWRTDTGMLNIQHNIKCLARKYQIKCWPIHKVPGAPAIPKIDLATKIHHFWVSLKHCENKKNCTRAISLLILLNEMVVVGVCSS